MKKLIFALSAAGVLLSGCIAVPYDAGVSVRDGRGPYGYGYDRDRGRPMRDRDGDGVPNRYDQRPNNPYRY